MTSTWSSLGAITPTLRWQLYEVPVVGTETFRVRSTWTIRPYWKMRAYLGQFFSTTTDVTGWKRIYPIKDTNPTIDLLIPEDFKRNGQITRYIGIKLGGTRGSYAHDWQVELDKFVGDSPPVTSGGTSFLPGQIPGLF